MCLPVIARVVSIKDGIADIELIGGDMVRANAALRPDAAPGAHVLVDRGLIIEVIDLDEVENLLDFYSQLENLWAEEDSRSV